MAEKAANFAFASEAKPSIFNLLSANSLNNELNPALRKISEFASESSPTYFGWLYSYHDETFLILNGFLQYYYLKKYGASFSEYFWDLQRVPVNATKLSDKERKLSLLFLVLIPYLKRKLEDRLNLYKVEAAEGLLQKNINSKVKKLLIHSQSTLEVSWSLWLLTNYLRYMSDATIYQNPILQLLKIRLVYASEQKGISLFWFPFFKGKLTLKEFGTGLLQHGGRTLIEVGSYFVQFLQRWYAENPNYNIEALPPVPPPDVDPKAERYSGKCPVCLQAWKHPTALPQSGYVFCLSCILTHLQTDQRCPVTNIPVKIADIIRIFDS